MALDENSWQQKYVEINPDLASWLTENKGMSFTKPEDAYTYQFGSGKVVSGQELSKQGIQGIALNAQYFQPDSGDTSKVQNTLPEYDAPEFADNAWMIPAAIIGVGFAASAMGLGGAAGLEGATATAGAEGLGTVATGDAALGGATAEALAGTAGTATGAPGAAADIINVGATELTPVDTMADSLIQPAVDSGGLITTEPAGAFDMGGVGGGVEGAGGPTGWTPSGGFPNVSGTGDSLIDQLIGWGKNNQILASGIVQAGGGLLKGAFAPSPEENYNAMYQARTQSEIAIADWNRKRNSLAGIDIKVRPTGRMLREPGGLIRNSMR